MFSLLGGCSAAAAVAAAALTPPRVHTALYRALAPTAPNSVRARASVCDLVEKDSRERQRNNPRVTPASASAVHMHAPCKCPLAFAALLWRSRPRADGGGVRGVELSQVLTLATCVQLWTSRQNEQRAVGILFKRALR